MAVTFYDEPNTISKSRELAISHLTNQVSLKECLIRATPEISQEDSASSLDQEIIDEEDEESEKADF